MHGKIITTLQHPQSKHIDTHIDTHIDNRQIYFTKKENFEPLFCRV